MCYAVSTSAILKRAGRAEYTGGSKNTYGHNFWKGVDLRLESIVRTVTSRTNQVHLEQ